MDFQAALPRFRDLAIAALTSLTLVACGGSDESEQKISDGETASENASDAPPEAAAPAILKPERRELETEVGRFTSEVGSNIDLPDEFPGDVPKYPEGIPTVSLTAPGGGVMVSFESRDRFNVAATRYGNELKEAGWKIDESTLPSGDHVFSGAKDSRKLNATIRKKGAGSEIRVIVFDGGA